MYSPCTLCQLKDNCPQFYNTHEFHPIFCRHPDKEKFAELTGTTRKVKEVGVPGNLNTFSNS
jgi:hypothetical protein